MALPFDAGEAFAFDKPALHPCANLTGYRCGLHARLVASGFAGCARFDCLGAGQRVMAEVFPGADWRRDPDLRGPLAEAFALMRRIHEALELLVASERLTLPPDLAEERATLRRLFNPEVGWSPARLIAFDLTDARQQLSVFLARLRDHL